MFWKRFLSNMSTILGLLISALISFVIIIGIITFIVYTGWIGAGIVAALIIIGIGIYVTYTELKRERRKLESVLIHYYWDSFNPFDTADIQRIKEDYEYYLNYYLNNFGETEFYKQHKKRYEEFTQKE